MIEKRFENRLDRSNTKFNVLNPVWDNEKEDALNVFEMIDELNRLNLDCSNLIDDNTEYVAEINQIHKENEQLRQENSIFEGKDAKHYQRWIHQIKKYVEESNPNFEYNDDFIIKIALSYTLQSLRNNESLERFQWL